jgi:hypothetical protein
MLFSVLAIVIPVTLKNVLPMSFVPDLPTDRM